MAGIRLFPRIQQIDNEVHLSQPMSFWFVVSLLGLLVVVPFHFLSVEHDRLDKKFGEHKGVRIGAALGMISGWGFFLFLIGLWISPQERFLLQISSMNLFGIPLLHLLLAISFLLPGAWLGIKGVSEVGLKTAETHRAECIISTGVYSHVRHPQYLGSIFSHIGVSFLFSGLYSLFCTPLVVVINYVLCWKEEKELVREFGDAYLEYQKNIPMLLPRRKKN